MVMPSAIAVRVIVYVPGVALFVLMNQLCFSLVRHGIEKIMTRCICWAIHLHVKHNTRTGKSIEVGHNVSEIGSPGNFYTSGRDSYGEM